MKGITPRLRRIGVCVVLMVPFCWLGWHTKPAPVAAAVGGCIAAVTLYWIVQTLTDFRRPTDGLLVIGFLSLLYVLLLPALAPPRMSRSGIISNLRHLELIKKQLQEDGNTNEWPHSDVGFSQTVRGRPLNERLRRNYGELYFMNRTGAPPFAYIPAAAGPYRGGEILVLTSNGLTVQRQ